MLFRSMMEIPSTPWTEGQTVRPARLAPVKARWRPMATGVSHTFTHFRLELAILRASVPGETAFTADGEFRWVKPSDLADEALPSLMRKIVAAARAAS